MAQPGLGRAIWFGILGFMLGALFVTLIRTLQQLTPLWDSGVGIIIGFLFSVFFFTWGIGAFNLRLSAHGEGPEIEKIHHDLEQKARAPGFLLRRAVWQLGGLLLLFLLAIFAFAAFPGGLALTTTITPGASTTMIGYIPVIIGGQTLQVSTLVVFILFIGFVLLSLAAIGGLLGTLVFRYDRSYRQSVAQAKAAAAALGAGAPAGLLAAPDPVAAAAVAAPAGKPMVIALPKWLRYLLVFGSLAYFANFPLMALTNAQVPLAAVWPMLWLLFLASGVVLFLEIVPAAARPIDAVVKFALTALAAHVVIGLAASWFATQTGMVIDPFFAAVIAIIGQVMALAAPAAVLRRDARMGVLSRYSITFAVLYAVFFYAAIGLIIPQEPAKTVLSVANALLFVAVIWRLSWLLGLLGQGAALLARLLRWLPKCLFQRG